MKSLNKKFKQDSYYTLTTTVIIGELMGGFLVERLASGGIGADQIALLTTRRILISLCF